ncbi:MAG: ABC transporter ATP-binding protein [Desulfurococcales archaeon]|nr:ABC transporter ATP-binding protein [Desulfurococcales archaeon]
MTRIRLVNVTKVFGTTVAVDHVNLEIESGEFFTIIGPSGCGKSTTLRIIAGFEVPEEGQVFFNDKDVTFVKPYERGTAMVFQNYALWPHMTVYENIAYGLRLRGLPEEEIKKRVKEVLELVDLVGHENRYPIQLSGGQQQRVALARALVVEPSVLLLDEPLSNLDAKLRLEMREELKNLQRRLGITTVYVTHDQIEALSMSDRIAVMNRGRILQVGKPDELYFRPRNLFVADFLGRSNILDGTVVGPAGEGQLLVHVPSIGADLVMHAYENLRGKVKVIIRPESIVRARPEHNINLIDARVINTMFLGDKLEVRLRVGEASLIAYFPNNERLGVDETIRIHIPPDRVVALEASG